MSVLIAHLNARSPSAEIAEQIADRLLKAGFTAVVRPIDQIESIQLYQALVFGGAVHDQQWLPEAAGFLRRFSDELARLPVWLFSTCSDSETSAVEPQIATLVQRTCHERAAAIGSREHSGFRDHRHFDGAFARGGWSQLGDLFLKICGGSPNDRRDWHDVNEWAAAIARELQAIDHVRERRRLHLSVRGKP
ncbi:MAG: flavodoxin domain-containing protein [Pseudomonadota bacterium]